MRVWLMSWVCLSYLSCVVIWEMHGDRMSTIRNKAWDNKSLLCYRTWYVLAGKIALGCWNLFKHLVYVVILGQLLHRTQEDWFSVSFWEWLYWVSFVDLLVFYGGGNHRGNYTFCVVFPYLSPTCWCQTALICNNNQGIEHFTCCLHGCTFHMLSAWRYISHVVCMEVHVTCCLRGGTFHMLSAWGYMSLLSAWRYFSNFGASFLMFVEDEKWVM